MLGPILGSGSYVKKLCGLIARNAQEFQKG